MAKLLDKFTKPFQDSRIPFLLAEVITNGAGDMVDVVCRFSNEAAASLLNIPAEELRGSRFTRTFPAQRLSDVAALQNVAFSGSCATFSYTTLVGQTLRVTCFQPMYGLASCILDAPSAVPQPQQPLGEQIPLAAAVVELTRGGVRCLSFNQRLCQWTGLDRKTLLDRHAEDLSSLVVPEDWPELLQALLDAARERRPASRDFRLLRRDAPPLWVNLQAEPLSASTGAAFYTVLTDVDAQHRLEDRMRERIQQTEWDRKLLEDLVDHLPGGCCLFHRDREGHLEALRASRGLQEFLGYSEPELLRRLSADPAWRVSAAGKGPLLEQAAQARQQGVPLRRLVQVRPKGGGLRWLSVEAVWEPQEDGGHLICVFCTDATEETEVNAQRQFRSQLCDLLLDRSRVMIMDYDPAQDLARMERYTAGGAKVTRTVAGYLAGLPEADTIHPEDRRKLAASMRKALLLGKVENVDRDHAAALRYQQLTASQKKLSPGLLAIAMLDLTADRILNAKSSGRHLTQVLFGNTADACLRHLRDNVPDLDARNRFESLFRREYLLASLGQGCRQLSMEHPLSLAEGAPAWCCTTVELAEDPDSGHVIAFCALRDETATHRQTAVLETLAQRDYALLLTVEVASGICRVYGPLGKEIPSGITYRVLLTRYLRQRVPSPSQRAALRAVMGLETALDHLETTDPYTVVCPIEEGPSLQVCWSWLDQADGVLLLTGRWLPLSPSEEPQRSSQELSPGGAL